MGNHQVGLPNSLGSPEDDVYVDSPGALGPFLLPVSPESGLYIVNRPEYPPGRALGVDPTAEVQEGRLVGNYLRIGLVDPGDRGHRPPRGNAAKGFGENSKAVAAVRSEAQKAVGHALEKLFFVARCGGPYALRF